MNRRTFLRAGAAAAVPLIVSRATGEEAPSRPNVLFLFTDDQRFDTLSALGNPTIRTPNMDRLVQRGLTFTHTYIMGGDQGAICICSRACLLTGRTLWRAPHNPGEDLPLWPEVFRKAGYATFGTGKWHNGPASFARCFTAGGNIFFGGMSSHTAVPVHDFDPSGKYVKASARKAEGFSSTLFSDAAIKFLREYKAADPFFAYVSYTAPHDPRTPPPEFMEMYKPADMPLPENFAPDHPFDNGELRVRDENLAPHPRTPEVVREHIAAYYAMISHVDYEIGRVLQALEETGRADNTIIIFAGDNGLAVGQHGLLGKQNLYEHSVCVPLVICAPGAKAGSRCDSPVYLHDIFPTVCDVAGLPVPQTVEGRSLAPAVRGGACRPYEHVYAAYRDVQRMVTDGRWKLITYPKVGVTQLFDLSADPYELRNLADLPDHAGQLARLRLALAAEMERCGDKLGMKSA